MADNGPPNHLRFAPPHDTAHLPLEWRIGSWSQLESAAAEVRRTVFIDEMGVAEELDFDGTDGEALHVVARLAGRPVATGRLHLPEARIGRMAVLAEYRRVGIGARLLERLIAEATRAGFRDVSLHAQVHAIPFYRRFGFREEGAEFTEAGIQHRRMTRDLRWQAAVAAVIVRHGRLLLGLRAPEIVMGGHWDLFGGRIEAGESDKQALRRELREELAVDARIGPQLEICLYHDPRDQTVYRTPVFLVTEWQGGITLNDEHTECRWFAPQQLVGLRLAHPAIPELLAAALAALKQSGDR